MPVGLLLVVHTTVKDVIVENAEVCCLRPYSTIMTLIGPILTLMVKHHARLHHNSHHVQLVQ